MGLFGLAATFAQMVLAAAVIARSSLPSHQFSDESSTSGIGNPRGGPTKIDIGLEIHKMHLRKTTEAATAVWKENTGKNPVKEENVNKLPVLDSPVDFGGKGHQEMPGIENQMPNLPDTEDALEQELKQADNSVFELELQELDLPESGCGSKDVASGLSGLGNGVILPKFTREPLQSSSEHTPMKTVLTRPHHEMSSIAEDLLNEPLHHGKNLDAQLQRLADNPGEGNASDEAGDNEELHPSVSAIFSGEGSGSSDVDKSEDISGEGSGSNEAFKSDDFLEFQPSVSADILGEGSGSDEPGKIDGEFLEVRPSVSVEIFGGVSGSDEANNIMGFLEFHPSSEIVDPIPGSGSGSGESYVSIPYPSIPKNILSDDGLSESGEVAADMGNNDAPVNEEISFTDVPLLDTQVLNNDLEPTHVMDQIQDLQTIPMLVSQLRDSRLTSITQEKGQGEISVVVSVEERLEVELERLSFLAPNNLSEENVKENLMTPKPTTGLFTVIRGGESKECPLDQLACRSGSQCIAAENFCDLVQDCADGTDEYSAVCVSSRRCGSGFIKCGSSAQCISATHWCDGIYHCHNGEDEKDCYSCRDVNDKTRVLLIADICDGIKDCADGSDENPQRCELPCTPGYHKCQDGLQCIRGKLFCDGVHNCRDQSDELGCGRTTSDCEALGMFACDGLCLPLTALCDYTYDCTNGMDESGCGSDQRVSKRGGPEP